MNATYQPTIEFRGLIWTHDPDGEYGEYFANYKGHKLVVDTDRNGNDWQYYVDDGEHCAPETNTMRGAMLDAIQEVDDETD